MNGILMIAKHTLLQGDSDNQVVNLGDKPDGTYFYDTFLIVKKDKQYKVLSNKCTHAGCRISSQRGNELMCSCHGSVFSQSGEVLKGPATKPLQQLAHTVKDSSGEIIVQIHHPE